MFSFFVWIFHSVTHPIFFFHGIVETSSFCNFPNYGGEFWEDNNTQKKYYIVKQRQPWVPFSQKVASASSCDSLQKSCYRYRYSPVISIFISKKFPGNSIGMKGIGIPLHPGIGILVSVEHYFSTIYLKTLLFWDINKALHRQEHAK